VRGGGGVEGQNSRVAMLFVQNLKGALLGFIDFLLTTFIENLPVRWGLCYNTLQRIPPLPLGPLSFNSKEKY
jgi:hypothetical protein